MGVLRSTIAFLLLHTILVVSNGRWCVAYNVQDTSLDGGRSNNGLFPNRRSIAEGPTSTTPVVASNSSFTLAAERTRRRDPLDHFNIYTRGWNIRNEHYWTSVGFSAAPFVIIAGLWFLGFGLAMLLMCCCMCFCPRRSYNPSKVAYVLALVCLILFTICAIIGCIILYNGQQKFYKSTSGTLDYVVDQADLVSAKVQNVSDILVMAKHVKISNFTLEPGTTNKIDDVKSRLKSSSYELTSKTHQNSDEIRPILSKVRLALVIVAGVMLLLTFVGFLLSLLGMQCLVSTLVFIGWILVTITFVLTAGFLVLHNTMADTCVAMQEWVAHPLVHTTLDDILPCVEPSVAEESLHQTKDVAFQLVNVVNGYISNVSNQDFPSFVPIGDINYNQAGPKAPLLCNPFFDNLSDRGCRDGEVNYQNAAQSWRKYICETTDDKICTSVGRFTPKIYNELKNATAVSFGLYHYGPFLAELQDCTFVRETFTSINTNNCPGLQKYSMWVYAGLAMVSIAVMLSLIFWLVYSQERRHRKNYAKVPHVPATPTPMRAP